MTQTGQLNSRVSDTEAAVIGTLGASSADALRDYLSQNPNTQLLNLVFVPGSEDDEATRELLQTVISYGLDTNVDSDGFIASGGVDLWLAGRRETVKRALLSGFIRGPEA